jgi:hypothetical protein
MRRAMRRNRLRGAGGGVGFAAAAAGAGAGAGCAVAGSTASGAVVAGAVVVGASAAGAGANTAVAAGEGAGAAVADPSGAGAKAAGAVPLVAGAGAKAVVLSLPLSVPFTAPLARPVARPFRWPLSVPFDGPDTGSNFVVAAGTGVRLVAVIGSVVGQAGCRVAAMGCTRTVGVSLVRWGWVGTWLDVTPRSCQNTFGDPVPGDQQKMIPHGLRVVVVVVVVVGRRVVVVVGRVVVVVVTFDVVVIPVVVVVVVVVPDEDDVVVGVFVLDDPDLEDDVVPVAVAVRIGCSLPRTTTISPPSAGSRPRGLSAVLACARRAAIAAPIRAPKASRPDPPSAESIVNDYRPHSSGSNPSAELVPARHFGYQAGTSGQPAVRVTAGGSRSA